MKVTAFFIRFVTDILFQSRCVTFQAAFSHHVLNHPRWSPGFVPEKGLFPFPDGFLPHFRNSVRPHSPDIKQKVFWIMDSDLNHFFGFVSKRHFFNIPIFGLISIWIGLVLRLFRHWQPPKTAIRSKLWFRNMQIQNVSTRFLVNFKIHHVINHPTWYYPK